MDLDREKVLEWIKYNVFHSEQCRAVVAVDELIQAITNGDFDKEDSK